MVVTDEQIRRWRRLRRWYHDVSPTLSFSAEKRVRINTKIEKTQSSRPASLVAVLALCVWLLTAAAGQAADAPTAVSTAADQTALPASVRAVLQRRDLPIGSLSAVVLDLDSGESRLSLNADVPRNPASVMKLVTTLIALDTLGPAYRWRTEAYALGELSGDTLNGDLLLKGYGDPFLVTERVWQMLRSLRGTGLRRIDGELLIDDSYFRLQDHDPAAFDRQPLRAYNVAPNALMMNFKVVRYSFQPDVARDAVTIRLDPELENVRIVNRLSLANGRCRGYQRGVAIIPDNDYDEFTFSGRFPRGCDVYAMTRSALGHNEFTYGLFQSLWRDVGGELGGTWRNTAFTPEEDQEPFFSFDSWPLADVISRVNKYSNNVMARQLLLTVAAEQYGAPGTEENGRLAVHDWMTRRGFDDNEFVLMNGAGLSRAARISAVQLGELLRYAYDSPYMPEFLSSMSLIGLDGTTSRRFDESDQLIGQAHLKTGSLDDVSAIAGYVQARSGDRYIVVSLQNHTDVHRGYGEEVQEALLRWVYAQ